MGKLSKVFERKRVSNCYKYFWFQAILENMSEKKTLFTYDEILNQMIEDDRYCGDVLIQIAAVSKSLQSLGNKILEKHLKTCVADEIKAGNIDIIDDVMLLIKKLK